MNVKINAYFEKYQNVQNKFILSISDDTFKKNQAEKIAEKRLHRELEKQLEYFKKAKIE